MKTLATYSIKGGVGKTSAAVNLGALAAADGLRTVLWDLDPQGAASFLFRIKPKVKGGGRRLIRDRDPLDVMKGTDVEGLDLLPADFSYRNLDLELDRRKKPLAGVGRVLAQLEGDYDLAILDCPPSISLVSESVFSAADLLLVPLIPSTLSVRTLEQLRRFLAGVEQPAPEVLAFFSMVDRRKKLHRELVASLPGRRRRGDPERERGRADGGAARAGRDLRAAAQGRGGLRRAVGAGPRRAGRRGLKTGRPRS